MTPSVTALTGSAWRSTSLTAERHPRNGLQITDARPKSPKYATALVQGAHQANGVGEVTVIPTAAISLRMKRPGSGPCTCP